MTPEPIYIIPARATMILSLITIATLIRLFLTSLSGMQQIGMRGEEPKYKFTDPGNSRREYSNISYVVTGSKIHLDMQLEVFRNNPEYSQTGTPKSKINTCISSLPNPCCIPRYSRSVELFCRTTLTI